MLARLCIIAALATLGLGPMTVARSAPPPARAASVIGPASKVESKAGKFYPTIYHDVGGERISKAAFLKRARTGQQYRYAMDRQGRHWDLTLCPAGTAPPGCYTMVFVPFKSLRPGQRMPAFALHTLDGRAVHETTLRGRPTLVNFFFAECVPCIAEAPRLTAYAKAHPGLRVLAVTFDDQATAREFVSTRHFTWPVVYAGNALMERIGVQSYPILALFDARGRLINAVVSTQLAKSDIVEPAEIDRWVRANLSAHGASSGRR